MLPKRRKLRLTFSAASKVYLDRQRDTKAKNLVAKEQHLRLHLMPYLGNMRIDRISTFTLDKFRRHLEQADLSVGTRNRVATTYNHMARKLLEWRSINSPMPLLKAEPEHNRREYVLAADDENRLLDAALRDGHPYIWLFVMIGLHSSMRHKEILSARFEHFDANRRRLGVRVKGGRWREQPLTKALAEIVAKERDMADDRDGWIFPSNRAKSGRVESMTKAFRRCVIAAGLNPIKITPHTMRHTAISNLASSGAD